MDADYNEFIDKVRSLTPNMSGYTLEYEGFRDVATYIGAPNNIRKIDYNIATSKVKVEFSFSLESRALVNVSIFKTSDTFFTVDEFLDFSKMKETKLRIFHEKFPKKLESIIELFNGPMNDIITGKRWENILHDWTSY